jgi:hypothetical protein
VSGRRVTARWLEVAARAVSRSAAAISWLRVRVQMSA